VIDLLALNGSYYTKTPWNERKDCCSTPDEKPSPRTTGVLEIQRARPEDVDERGNVITKRKLPPRP